MRLIFLLFLLLPLHNSWAFDLFGRNAAQADEAKPPESGPHSKDSKEEYLKDAATKEGVKVVANDRWRKEQKKLKRNRDRQRQQKRRDAKLAWGETDELRKSLVTVDESILGGDAATAAKNGVDAISAKVCCPSLHPQPSNPPLQPKPTTTKTLSPHPLGSIADGRDLRGCQNTGVPKNHS